MKVLVNKETGETADKEITISADEGNRPQTTLADLQKLNPVFKGGRYVPEGKFITAGNASQLSDGASACVLMDAKLASQRTPKDFRNPAIKSDRPLRRDPGYRPEFPNTPIVVTELPVSLAPDELAAFHAVKRTDIYGDDDAAALRDLLFSWWEERFLQAHAGAPSIESE